MPIKYLLVDLDEEMDFTHKPTSNHTNSDIKVFRFKVLKTMTFVHRLKALSDAKDSDVSNFGPATHGSAAFDSESHDRWCFHSDNGLNLIKSNP